MRLARLICTTIFFLILFTPFYSNYAYEKAVHHPPKKWGVDLEIKGSYLYWGVKEDQIGFAIKNARSTELTAPIEAKLKSHGITWDNGVKVEAGLSSCHTPVGLTLGWTHFETQDRESVITDEPGLATIAVTASGLIGLPPFAEEAFSEWDFNLNEFSLNIDYPLFHCRSILIKPIVGVFGSHIKQKQKLFYTGIPLSADLTDDIIGFRKQNYWSVGPKIGFGLTWKLYKSVNLVGNTNLSYLFGRFNTKNQFAFAGEPTTQLINFHPKTYQFRPVFNGSLGLEWSERINCYSSFFISIAYEFQYWWSHWHLSSNFIDNSISGEGRWGDLSVQGLVITGGFAF